MEFSLPVKTLDEISKLISENGGKFERGKRHFNELAECRGE